MLDFQGPLLPVWRDPLDNGGRATAVRVRAVHEATVGGGCCEVLRQTHHERTAAQHQVGNVPRRSSRPPLPRRGRRTGQGSWSQYRGSRQVGFVFDLYPCLLVCLLENGPMDFDIIWNFESNLRC